VRLEQRVTVLEQLPARIDGLALQISQLHEAMRTEFSAMRKEMRELNEATNRQMRVLHEDAIARIALIREANPRRPKRR
jgi:hypothetical protein